MAEVIFRKLVSDDRYLSGRVHVTSAGTANWHVGNQMDLRARTALDRAGFALAGSPGAFADSEYLNHQDIVVVMTREHVHEVTQRLINELVQVIMLRNLLEPGGNLDVADPYYGSDKDFDECLELITQCALRLTWECRRRLGEDSNEA